jgi:hypothetical protein
VIVILDLKKNLGLCSLLRTHHPDYTCNPNTWETEAGGFQVPGQHGLHSEAQKTEKEKRRKEKTEDTYGDTE